MKVTFRQRVLALFMRSYPFLSGSNKIINKSWMKRFIGDGGDCVWTTSPGGVVCADLNDYIGRSVYYTGDLDPKITFFCREYLQHGDCAVDAGANIGIVTLVMAESVGHAGAIFAYEPNPLLFGRLSGAIQRAGAKQVQPKMIALGKNRGISKLIIPSGNSGAASLKRHRRLSNTESVDVPTETLDREIISFNSMPVLIKLDVEGCETEVLEGMCRLLKESPPGVIIFEANPDPDSGEIDPRPFEILVKNEYKIFAFRSTLLRIVLDEIRFSNGRPDKGHDFVALHAEKGLNDAEIRLAGQVSLNTING